MVVTGFAQHLYSISISNFNSPVTATWLVEAVGRLSADFTDHLGVCCITNYFAAHAIHRAKYCRVAIWLSRIAHSLFTERCKNVEKQKNV